MTNWLLGKAFQFTESILNLLPFFVLSTLSMAVLVFFFQGRINFAQLIELLGVLIWPAVVLLLFLFFRKVFTYLFFSIEEFNFFGAKGKLKNVRLTVMEKAEEMYETRIRLDIQEKEKEETKNELTRLRTSEGDQNEKNAKIIDLAQRIIEDKNKLVQENNLLKKKLESVYSAVNPTTQELQFMINDLLKQIESLQKHDSNE